jgi:hypothetical protein
MEYKVNDSILSYTAVGDKAWGEDIVLINSGIDLTAKTEWHSEGYSIQKLFAVEEFGFFQKGIKKILIDLWKKSGLPVDEDSYLNQYHLFAKTKEEHLKAVEGTKLISVAALPGSVQKLEKRITEIVGQEMIAKNPWDNTSVFHFRVVRPDSHDNNPLHRDVWLEDYDDCINLYIPIAGSNEKSSLIIIPGSHLWKESRIEKTKVGAEINGVKFNVPAITAIEGSYDLVRPSPMENQVLIFSPYLVHGGAVNLNKDETRISIEMRLWKKTI